MNTKLESLSKAQEAKIPEYRDKWLAIGLSTSESSEEDYQKCFEGVEILLERKLKGYQVCDSPSQLKGVLKDKSNFNQSSFGSFEASWLSFYDYFDQEVEEVDVDTSLLQYFIFLAQHVTWTCVEDEVVYFSRKPVEIHMVDGQLHNDNGPSILFADGFSVYSINGYRVTEKIVMRPEDITVKEIHSETNADIQTIMVDRFGWERYIQETGAELLDSRKNDIENTMEALYKTSKFGRRLVCTCPTGRVFVKGIKSQKSTNTCEGAQKWLSGYGKSRKFVTVGRT